MNNINPTEEDLKSPEFNAVWEVIKKWDISRNVDKNNKRWYANADGTDVMSILNVIRPEISRLKKVIVELQEVLERKPAKEGII